MGADRNGHPHVLRLGAPVENITLAVECVGTKHSGGATVLRDLLPVLAADPRFSHILLYATPREKRTFEVPASEKVEERPRPREERSYVSRIQWYLRGLGDTCRRDGVDVLLCANGLGLAGELPRVALVQQALPYSVEALKRLSVGERVRMAVIRRLTCLSLRSVTAVAAQSGAMAETLRVCCQLGSRDIAVCRPTVSAFPEGKDEGVREVMAAWPTGRRLLYVGSSAPHKNLVMVARAMRRLRERVSGATLFVTCSPQEVPRAWEGVVPLGFLGRQALGTAYAEATAVVQPSLVESGPLVPPEAMGAGRPLLAADRPWARDACGMAALFFDPTSEEDFVNQAERLLMDAELRDALVTEAARRRERVRSENSYQGLADLIEWAYEVNTRKRKRGAYV